MTLDRRACERRAYRLAALLRGDSARALAVMEQVLAARPDLRTLDGAHLDRLTILACREAEEGTWALGGVAQAVARTLAGLTFQQREAWVLARLYAVPPRETARAMDCSNTATRRHLEQADAMMAVHATAIPSLRAWANDLDLPGLYRATRRRREQTRRLLIILACLAVVAGVFAALAWLARHFAGA